MNNYPTKETPKFGKHNTDPYENILQANPRLPGTYLNPAQRIIGSNFSIPQGVHSTSTGPSGNTYSMARPTKPNFPPPGHRSSAPSHTTENFPATSGNAYDEMLKDICVIVKSYEEQIRAKSLCLLDEDYSLSQDQIFGSPDRLQPGHLPQGIVDIQPMSFTRKFVKPPTSKCYVRTQKLIRTGNELTLQSCIGQEGLDKKLGTWDLKKFENSKDLPKYLPYQSENKLEYL